MRNRLIQGFSVREKGGDGIETVLCRGQGQKFQKAPHADGQLPVKRVCCGQVQGRVAVNRDFIRAVQSGQPGLAVVRIWGQQCE